MSYELSFLLYLSFKLSILQHLPYKHLILVHLSYKLSILYGKLAYFELSSHQISEPKQQAKRENIYLAKISERLAN